MLEQILRKLGCKTLDEFFENEKRLLEKYAGMEIERKNPLLRLSDEELDYWGNVVLPARTQAK